MEILILIGGILGVIFLCYIFIGYIIRKKRPLTKEEAIDNIIQNLKITTTVTYTGGPNDIGEPDIRSLFCTCNEFKEYRQNFSKNDPRRLCQHLVKGLNNENLPEDLVQFKPEISYWVSKNDGVRIYKYMTTNNIDGRKIILSADNYDESVTDYWVNILCDGERYGFCPEKNRWSYRQQPLKNSESIEKWIKNKIEEYRPQPLREGSIKTTYRNHGKTKYSFKGEVGNKIIWAYIKPEKYHVDIKVGSFDFGNSHYNLETKRLYIHPRLYYMEKAILKWIEGEVYNLKELVT